MLCGRASIVSCAHQTSLWCALQTHINAFTYQFMSHAHLISYYTLCVQYHLLVRQDEPDTDSCGTPDRLVYIPSDLGLPHILPDGVMVQVRLHLVIGRYQARLYQLVPPSVVAVWH